MLEPRRLAARAAANRMAGLLGEPVGHTVGYRMRMERRVSGNTRIEVVTEGILTRMLQSDAPLTDVGLVIFDEFHERSLQADLGLTLCLEKIDLGQVLKGQLDWRRQKALDRLAPIRLQVPSGRTIPIDYRVDPPVLAVRLQEMFGQSETPTVAGGRQPLRVHLLSPAGRPVQITQDLAGFWQTGYNEVRKALRGRYPKHYWPDDPLGARATHRVRPRRS